MVVVTELGLLFILLMACFPRFAEVKKLMKGEESEERKMARFYQLMEEQEEDNEQNMW